MSSRRVHSDPEFGSDSFLDVVANIVGILIILIVIAGLKVARQPVVLPPPATSPLTATEPVQLVEVPSVLSEPDASENTVEADVAAEPEVLNEEPISLPVAELPLEELPELTAPTALVERSQKLARKIEKIQQLQEKLSARKVSAERTQQDLLHDLSSLQKRLCNRQDELEQALTMTRQSQENLMEARELLARLRQEVVLAESQQNVTPLEHRVTPVSRIVSGPEKHFRMEKNRVAEVPIDDLVAKVKEQIERRKEWLAKMNRHQGEVGPVRGFRLQYVVQRENSSVMDELRMGSQVFRISVSQWVILPESRIPDESAAEAMRAGSRFYAALLDAGRDSTLTFWVYPDSFETFRVLQKFAHEKGFHVAGRPLPPGMPIAGSPNGSKSAAQ